MAKAEQKKINLNFNGLSKADLNTIAQETLVSAKLPAAISDLSGERQIALLCDLSRDLREDRRSLHARPDFAAMINAKGSDAQYEAFQAMTPETNEAWEKLGEKRKALKNLKFHLYMQSPDPNVRLRMMREVDRLIAKEITKNNTGRVTDAFWHDLLYLSTFGGKITRERTDVYHIAYEFNAKAKGSTVKYAVPWNPMEILHDAGMTRNFDGETAESNLTPAGKAVLVRFNELHGKSQAQRLYKAAP